MAPALGFNTSHVKVQSGMPLPTIQPQSVSIHHMLRFSIKGGRLHMYPSGSFNTSHVKVQYWAKYRWQHQYAVSIHHMLRFS